MALKIPIPPPGFDDLSVEEKVDYVQALWERIAARPETVPVPDWHRDVIRERLENDEAERAGGGDWNEFREEVHR